MIDAHQLRRALRDFIRFNPKDFFVQASPTSLLVSAANKSSTSLPLGIFTVVPATPPKGHENETGWVKVVPTGTVLASIDPTDNIAITGLDEPFPLDIDGDPQQYVYIYLDVTSLFDPDTPGPVTGQIGSGKDWNGESGDFFPLPYEFDTEDGTLDNDAPSNAKQISYYFPLARTYDITDNPLDPIDPDGFMLTPTVKCAQISNTNYRLDFTCAQSKTIAYAVPWHGAIEG